MSVDNTATAERNAKRQRLIADELEEAVDLLNRGPAAGTSGEFLLVAELLRRFRAGPRVLGQHNSYIASAVSGAGNVVERHLARKTTSNEEYNYLLMQVAKRLLEAASVEIEARYHDWQAKQ